jgi:hypothetical protein
MANHQHPNHEQNKQAQRTLEQTVPQAVKDIQESPLPKSQFDKDATIQDMNSFYKAYSYSRREKHAYPVFVTDEVFDILTDGDTKTPLFWKGEGTTHGNAVPIIPESRRQAGLDIFNCTKKTHIVTVG